MDPDRGHHLVWLQQRDAALQRIAHLDTHQLVGAGGIIEVVVGQVVLERTSLDGRSVLLPERDVLQVVLGANGGTPAKTVSR